MWCTFGRTAISTRCHFGKLPYIRGVFPIRINLNFPILLLIGVFNIWITHIIQIERVIIGVLDIPEKFLISWGKEFPSSNSCSIIPYNFLDKKELGTVPQ